MIILGSGFIQPNQNWQSLELPVDSQAIVCEFQSPGPWENIESQLLVRRSFKYLTKKINDIDFRLYPTIEAHLISLSTLPPVIYSSAEECSIEVLKLYKFKQYSYNEPNWKVQLSAIL